MEHEISRGLVLVQENFSPLIRASSSPGSLLGNSDEVETFNCLDAILETIMYAP